LNLQAAIRSLLGIALTLVAVSLGSLWACASYAARTHANSDPFASLPLFFNRAPVGIAELAQTAMRDVSRGGPDAERASRELARLGGAALPYVLPALDSLDPESRVRVALALTRVAERMEVGNRDDFSSGDQAVLFWTRFWQDRAIDFRAPAVRHSTARLAEREVALRREDLIHVDTFALPSLIEALGEVKTPSDAARIERLDSVLAHVTGRSVTLGAGANVDEAARSAEAWRDFWDLHGSEYTALDGPRRLVATFAETRYGKWLGDVLRGGFGRTRSGESARSLVARSLPATLLLLLGGLGGGFSLAVAWARFERRASTAGARYASAVLGTALAAIPCATFVRLLSGSEPSRASYLAAAAIVMLTTAAWVSRHLSRSTLVANGSSPLAGAFFVSAPLGATYPPFVLSAIVLVELGFHLPGLGGAAARALGSGDTNAWMAASLALALATLLLRELAELVRPRVTARVAEGES
jgi:hypothetical protein